MLLLTVLVLAVVVVAVNVAGVGVDAGCGCCAAGGGAGSVNGHYLIIKERKRFPLFFLPKYLIGREQKFQHNVSFDWSRKKRKAVDGLFPSVSWWMVSS